MRIYLSSGKPVLVDYNDFIKFNKFRWFEARYPRTSYAGRQVRFYRGDKQHTQFLHRAILNAPKGITVDHINGDGLDCRRKNLRLATMRDNVRNRRIGRANTSGFKGVYFVTTAKLKKPWHARIKVNYKPIHIGHFRTAREGGIAYNKAAKKYFGKFARLNIIP